MYGSKDERQQHSACIKQLFIEQVSTKVTQYANDSKRCEEISTAIAHNIAEDIAPVATVEHYGLKYLAGSLSKLFFIFDF